jgi:hypothetical protein
MENIPSLSAQIGIHSKSALHIDSDIFNPEWKIIDEGIHDDIFQIHGRDFSAVDSWFVIERRSYYYINFVIVPGILIVLVSYTSFWIDYKAVPGRVTICVIPVLTSVTMLSNSYSRLPRISY